MKIFNRPWITIAIVIAAELSATFSVQGQTTHPLDVRQIMSAQEYKDAGLDKLSPSELNSLNGWLQQFTARMQSARQDATSSDSGGPVQKTSVIESSIDGDFEGWSGETIFKLQNGQIWQQAEYDYDYNYDYSPDVTIYKSQECWKMQVAGMDEAICVKRLK